MLVLLMVGIYEVLHWYGPRWYDIGANFQNDQLKYLSKTMVITTTIWEAVRLVVLIEGTYREWRCDAFMQYDIHTKFHKDLFWHSKVNEGGYT
jgi:hypothetical protein